MKNQRPDMTSFCTLGIYALLLAGFLLLVLFGAGTYQKTVKSQRENEDRRAVLSYLSMTLRNHDHQQAVSVEPGPEGDVLVLTDRVGDDAYTTRIYQSEGMLLEEFAKSGTALGQGEIQSIGACSRFEIERMDGQDLCLRVEDGSVLVHLRSESGVSQ